MVLSLRKSAALSRTDGLELGRCARLREIRPAQKVASRRDRSKKSRRWRSNVQVTAVK